MIYPDFNLLKNVLLFSQALRKRRIGVTINNVLDALRGVSFIDISQKDDFYNLLKSNFVSHREETEAFDELFNYFWSYEKKTEPFFKKMVEENVDSFKKNEEVLGFKYEKSQSLMKDWTDEELENNRLKEQKNVPGYSPEEILRHKDFGHLQMAELEKVRELVSSISQKMAKALSRRWKRGKRGGQLDFRKTIRQSIKYGGEMIELRMKEQKLKPLRLILVCDVSGSMDIYGQFFLLFMHGLQNHYPHCETFVFSTRLSQVTFLLKSRTFDETLPFLSEKVLDWSGGTNIGAALHQLRRRHSEPLHANRTLLLIFSDGWDRGDAVLLDREMRNLKKQLKRLIWLNPLLGSRYYQPLCKGMSTILPYLDYFLPCHNFLNLRNLCNLISKM